MADFTIQPSNWLDFKKQRVLTAYFAKRTNTPIYRQTKQKEQIIHTVKSGEWLSKIAIKYGVSVGSVRKNNNLTSDTIYPEQKLIIGTKPKKEKIEDKVCFDKIDSANLGDEVYVVVETENMPERQIKMNLMQGGTKKVLTDIDDAIKVLPEGKNKANFLFTATVGEFAKENNVINADEYKNTAVVKIKIGSNDNKENKAYSEALSKANNTTKMFLALDAEPEDQNWFEVWYEEVVDNRPNAWYYGEGNWFELKNNTFKRAPWMEFAYNELGVEEIFGKKHNPRVLEYHNSSNSKGAPDEIPWCGAFVNWCMKQSEYNNDLPKFGSKAVRWKKYGKSVSKDNPPYGSIASIAWTKDTEWGAGHVGLLVNVIGDDFYLLGGNQKGGDKNTHGKVCISKYKKSQILSLNIPENYSLSKSDYQFDKIEKNKSGQYETLQSTR